MNIVAAFRGLTVSSDDALARKELEAEKALEKAMQGFVYTEEELRNEPSIELMVLEKGKTGIRTILKRDVHKFESLEVMSCDNCGNVHKPNIERCPCCGAPLNKRLKTVYELKPIRDLSSSSSYLNPWMTDVHLYTYAMSDAELGRRAGSPYIPSEPIRGGAVTGQITVMADDGDVQLETFTFNMDEPGMVTFIRTGQTFFVNRKSGSIVDIIVSMANGRMTSMDVMVNGRDTGVRKLLAGMVSTVNSRMPWSMPIPIGCAVQLRIR